MSGPALIGVTGKWPGLSFGHREFGQRLTCVGASGLAAHVPEEAARRPGPPPRSFARPTRQSRPLILAEAPA